MTFPPLAFTLILTVKFLHNEVRHGKFKYPKANTCECIIMLPSHSKKTCAMALAMPEGSGSHELAR